MTHTVSESFLLRRIRYSPAGNDLSEAVKLNGMLTTVWRSVCAKTDDETVTKTTKTVNAIALSMSFIMRSPFTSTNAQENAKGGHPKLDLQTYIAISLPISRQVISLI